LPASGYGSSDPMYRAFIFANLFAVWLVLSGLFDSFHIPLGVISCALVTWWSSDMLFADRSIRIQDRLRQTARVPGYALWLTWQIVVANFHVLKLALSPRLQLELEPQLVRFRSGLKSDFEKFVLAQSITLTPGTVTMEINGDEFIVHAISGEAAEGLTGPMAERVKRLFAID
jgi:multicomponent Na+:H+ antiporter subunit E